jgi:hypothetical protein
LSIKPRCGLGRNVISRQDVLGPSARPIASTFTNTLVAADRSLRRKGIYTTLRTPILCVLSQPRLCLRTSPSSTTRQHVSVSPAACTLTDYKYSLEPLHSVHLIHLGTRFHQNQPCFHRPESTRRGVSPSIARQSPNLTRRTPPFGIRPVELKSSPSMPKYRLNHHSLTKHRQHLEGRSLYGAVVGQYADIDSAIITISVGREQRLFAAHEDVLSHSPYLSAACSGQFFQSANKRIELTDENPEIFSSILEYLYKGK